MNFQETALGRLVPFEESSTILEDRILKLLFDYRMSPQNPNDVPMKLSSIATAISADEKLALGTLEALMENLPPYVRKREVFQTEPTFSITGTGIRFVRNIPQGMSSFL